MLKKNTLFFIFFIFINNSPIFSSDAPTNQIQPNNEIQKNKENQADDQTPPLITNILTNYHTNTLYATAHGRKITIFDTKTSAILGRIPAHKYHIHCATSTLNNSLLISSDNATIKIWNTRSHECVKTIPAPSFSIKLSAYNDLLACSNETNIVKTYNLSSGKETFKATISIKPLWKNSGFFNEILLNNNNFHAGTHNGKIIIIDLLSKKITYSIHAHMKKISYLLNSKTNPHIFYSGSADETVKIWDYRNTSAPLTLLKQKKIKGYFNSINNIYESKSGNELLILTECGELSCAFDLQKIQELSLNPFADLGSKTYPSCLKMDDDEEIIYIGTTDGLRGITLKQNLVKLLNHHKQL